ncbi:aminobenzoyl-glutamate utilization protein B [Maribacter dokdonensis]|uniref:Aminobenzoyl-glutamate utilization protein B n=1 Tax=Maribacter dokdonensis TaxID=320912 RepID=A0ABY0U099_9FLAO|nr:amidohydrolase [Maribacter dokdonensis]SDR85257.1 aminobenzoyl-glutamate utilization protein B [Maribacter dokdonensis]
MKKLIVAIAGVLFLQPLSTTAQKNKKEVLKGLDAEFNTYKAIANELWENPELGYLEENSSALLQETLGAAGFKVEKGVAGIPTAFTATYGSGSPVIGILGEFDALPGMSQSAEPIKKSRVVDAPGQACGHHLFGTGSMAAAISVKNWLDATKKSGTIRFYGTPAEEGGSGKVYMVRAGLFNDVDAIVSWHPGDQNTSNPSTNLATISGKFTFKGVSSHAAAAPELGRSALDGVEGMNDLVNMLREHTTESTRIHYVITKGGDAPNIVPEEAQVYYVVRHANRKEVKAVWDRVVKAAEGSAIGTETEMSYEIIGGTYDRLPNEVLATLMHKNMEIVGGVNYTPEEIDFAKEIQKTLKTPKEIESAGEIKPMVFTYGKASADTGDVSWNAPLAAVRTATWVPGTPPHSWQAVAAGGTDIGYKGMMVAAKTMALTAIDIFEKPAVLTKIKAEFNERRGADFKYVALLGDREPALDYRK